MTTTLRYDPESAVLYVKVTGGITVAEFQHTMEQIIGSSEFPMDVNSLWDLRELNLSAVDAEFWKRIIDVRKRFPQRGNARLAHVVDSDFGFGMMRMYELLSDSYKDGLLQKVMIFRSIPEAEKWLRS